MLAVYRVCIFLCLISSTPVSAYSPKDYALDFPNVGVVDLVNIWGLPSLTEFTVCLWMKSADAKGALFSYAASGGSNNELLILYSGRFGLYINGQGKATQQSAGDGKWHHICFSWENTAGSWKFYKDGDLAEQGKGFKIGHVIRSGGSLMLGQEQDVAGGSLDASQSYQGMLTNVNVWDNVLPIAQIEHMSKSCLSGEGNVYKWSDFIRGREGKPRVVIPSPCKPLHD